MRASTGTVVTLVLTVFGSSVSCGFSSSTPGAAASATPAESLTPSHTPEPPTATLTPTSSSTRTPEPSLTPSATPTLPPFEDWGGLWNVSFYANFAEMTVIQTGSSLTGSLSFRSITFTFTGTASEDGRAVSGRWQEEGRDHSGEFYWKLLENGEQFLGSASPEPYGHPVGGWCGYRPGLNAPPPCFYSPG